MVVQGRTLPNLLFELVGQSTGDCVQEEVHKDHGHRNRAVPGFYVVAELPGFREVRVQVLSDLGRGLQHLQPESLNPASAARVLNPARKAAHGTHYKERHARQQTRAVEPGLESYEAM